MYFVSIEILANRETCQSMKFKTNTHMHSIVVIMMAKPLIIITLIMSHVNGNSHKTF